MRQTRLAAVTLLTMALGVFAGPVALAQNEVQPTQQHKAQMQAMMRRMSAIEQQANRLSKQIAEHRKTGKDQAMESHRAMERMDQSMAAMAKEMKNLIFDALMMMQDQAIMGDSEMRADLISLGQHFEAAAGWMEGALEVMERTHERAPDHGSGH
jgi:hypothetical protein